MTNHPEILNYMFYNVFCDFQIFSEFLGFSLDPRFSNPRLHGLMVPDPKPDFLGYLKIAHSYVFCEFLALLVEVSWGLTGLSNKEV